MAGRARARRRAARPARARRARVRRPTCSRAGRPSWATGCGSARARDAVAAGLLGPVVTPAALSRTGDVVAVATGDVAVVRRRAEPFFSALLGQHGALTADELLVPLLTHVTGCPCGLPADYDDCCGRFHARRSSADSRAADALALQRLRRGRLGLPAAHLAPVDPADVRRARATAGCGSRCSRRPAACSTPRAPSTSARTPSTASSRSAAGSPATPVAGPTWGRSDAGSGAHAERLRRRLEVGARAVGQRVAGVRRAPRRTAPRRSSRPRRRGR